ncbi:MULTISPECIES: helix-turn-helix domain-containing protein [Escherichia]|uniref:AraC family transcriptional regulator n=2 Tax=Enterobacteriaceae TaxID=543 RepID=A0A5U1S2U6_SALER|nr:MULTISPECIES: helix-turn-helix domain-containing protein [Escherichia]EBO8151022.1 AraC family transcriptional regulator [Salmonella enterica]ECX9178202.1 helix-turn-helix transcriptional regulator [Salmonella enterica]EFB2828985.1 helix-turn-helix transcriptional regulator [Escherichia coli]MBB2310290.1 helix-turn-helix transcriptional regulator [Escherichia coli]MBB2332728.1 helix-turn-helix transcriptional regulator [Escherichia sp. 93.0816]
MKYMQKITTEIISEHIDRDIECGYRISVKEMADRSGYSLRHLQRMFIQETGIPLGEYIRRRRLSHTALLLRLSRRSFRDIALSVGFDSQQSMNRTFKKSTNLTPTQYRFGAEWVLSPLCGKINVTYEVSGPEIVLLQAGMITGKEFQFYGTIAEPENNYLAKAYLDSVFSHGKDKLWVVAQTSPVNHNRFHYKVSGAIGIPAKKKGKSFSWPAGRYMKVNFETTRETHTTRTQYIYLNVLSEHGVIRGSGADLLMFHHKDGITTCSLFIPIN